MTDLAAPPPKPKRLENRVRRGFELLLLVVSLIVGVGVVGGCGAVVSVMAETRLPFAGAAVLGAFLIGGVYLATSMSRDVRILKQKLLEKEQRSAQREERRHDVPR